MEATIYVHLFISFLSVFCMVFTVLLTFIYICQLIISFIRVLKNKKRMRSNDYKRYSLSKNILPVSLIIPAYNEEKNIVSNIRALMKINYPKYEIIVVNDGSDDDTHGKIISAFGLCKIDAAVKTSIPTKQVRGIYYSAEYPKLLYVDKENGGKSDALNAGINTSSYPLFAGLDADSRIEPDALLRICTEFLKNTDTVAAGGLIKISNGFSLKNGKAHGFSMPRKMIERFQIVEYCRSFFSGRVSWGAVNSLLIISGAFSVFKKQTVIEVGGYNIFCRFGVVAKTVAVTPTGGRTEDMKLFHINFNSWMQEKSYDESELNGYLLDTHFLCIIFEEPSTEYFVDVETNKKKKKKASLKSNKFIGFKRFVIPDSMIEIQGKKLWNDTRDKINKHTLTDVPNLRGGKQVILKNGELSSAPNWMKNSENTIFIRGSAAQSTSKNKTECVNGIRIREELQDVAFVSAQPSHTQTVQPTLTEEEQAANEQSVLNDLEMFG